MASVPKLRRHGPGEVQGLRVRNQAKAGEGEGGNMKGLVFSQPIIPAWLAGNKTVTRRLINPQPDGTWEDGRPWWDIGGLNGGHPRYQPGETVYIKETWCNINKPGITPEIYYKADTKCAEDYDPTEWRWKSPAIMPERASRSHALIVSVMPEQIRNVGSFYDEVLLEGWPFPGIDTGMPHKDFELLWNSLHPGSWEKNEWVWRYELEKVKK